jgi:hypothetical protein
MALDALDANKGILVAFVNRLPRGHVLGVMLGVATIHLVVVRIPTIDFWPARDSSPLVDE